MKIRLAIKTCFLHLASQVSAWKSATLLPISCKLVQPVPAGVEEPVRLVRQSSSGWKIHSFPRCPKPAREGRLSKLAYHASTHSAAGGEHDFWQQCYNQKLDAFFSFLKSKPIPGNLMRPATRVKTRTKKDHPVKILRHRTPPAREFHPPALTRR